MASTDATPFIRKGVAFRWTFPIYDKSGNLVTGAAGLDSEISKDGGTFADCTNEATEIASGSGIYNLDITSTETNADTIAVIVKTSTTDARTTVLIDRPVETGDIPVNVTAFGGTAGTFSSGRPEVNVNSLAANSVTASAVASDAVTEIQSGLATASALATVAGYVDTEVAAIKAKTDNLPSSPAAVSDIPTANANADALLDRTAGVETSWTLRQAMRIILSVLAGKSSGLSTTTAVYRDMADSKDRISATVDSSGNRSAVTRDAS